VTSISAGQASANDLDRFATDLVGRTWLFADVARWLENASARRLIVSGSPGCGKSAFAASLVRRQDEIKAYHFCDARRGGSLNPSTVARSLSEQLCRSLPGFQDALLQTALPNRPVTGTANVEGNAIGVVAGVVLTLNPGLNAEDEFETLLRVPLKKLAAPQRPIVLLINAVDSALAYSGKPHLVKLISRSTDFPEWVRWICTTRPNDDVMELLSDSKTTIVTVDSDANRADLATYVQSRVAAPQLAAQVVTASGQSFLYAKLLLDGATTAEALKARLKEPPQGIYDSFAQLLTEQLDDPHDETAQALLSALTVAQAPLDETQLAGIAQVKETALRGTVAKLRLLLEDAPDADGGKRYVLFHQALREFLLDRASGTYRVVLKEAHAALADYFLRVRDGYAWRWLGYHLAMAGREDALRALLWDASYVRGKLQATEPRALLSEYDYEPNDAALQLVAGAVRLSAATIARDPAQLVSQLSGRLMPYASYASIGAFLDALAKAADSPWVRALRPTLAAPGGAMLFPLRGHTEDVTSVAVTPNGKLAVSTSYDGSLCAWDIERGVRLAAFRTAPWSSGRAVAVTADGSLTAGGFDDGTILLWNIGAGTLTKTLRGHTDSVRAVTFADDGATVLSGSDDRTIKVWETASGRELQTLSGHSDAVTALAVMPDSRFVISSGADKVLQVWDRSTGTAIRKLTGHTWAVRAVAVTPDGRGCVSGSEDGTLRLWDVQSGETLRVMQGHVGWVRGVAVSPDGTRAVSCGDDATVRVWDLATGANVETLSEHAAPVTGIALTGDGRRAVSSSNDETLIVWSLAGGTVSRDVERHREKVSAVTAARDAACAVSASNDATLRVWTARGTGISRVLTGHKGAVTDVAVTQGGSLAISASWDKTLIVWDLANASALRTLGGHTSAVNRVALTADGARALSCSDDRTLKLWDVNAGLSPRTLQGHLGFVTAVALFADGKRAVSASSDSTLIMWDLESGTALASFAGHQGPIRSVAIAPDGTRAISASEDGTVRIWDLDRGGPGAVLYGHRNIVNVVRVTSDGRFAATASEDATVRLWDVHAAAFLAEFDGHTQGVVAVDLAADGRRLLSSSRDASVRLWNLEDATPVAAFTGDFGLTSCCFVDEATFVAGDERGFVHILALESEARRAQTAGR
jgi:WD40 repeat protein